MENTPRAAARPVRGRMAYLWTMLVAAAAVEGLVQLATPLAHWLWAALP